MFEAVSMLAAATATAATATCSIATAACSIATAAAFSTPTAPRASSRQAWAPLASEAPEVLVSRWHAALLFESGPGDYLVTAQWCFQAALNPKPLYKP